MNEIIYCNQCKNSGRQNRCYITGYDSRCGHNLTLAYNCHKNGSDIMVCSHCNNGNKCYITGYDYKCGHDNGWAYVPNQPNATCNSCGKNLNGKWSMETNERNISYFSWTTGRYLGISDGYFLYGDSPDWVYSYCKPCWIKEIEKILPSLGLANGDQQNLISEYKDKNAELQKIINEKEEEINKMKKEIEEKNNKLKEKEKEINDLKNNYTNNQKPQENLNSAPININLNNYENIISQCLKELEVEEIKDLLKSSEIQEVSELSKSLTLNIISLKAITDFKSICQTIIKQNIGEILEKIDDNIEKIKVSLNNINSIFDGVKEKLNNKDIPEKTSNESITPIKKLIDEKKKNLENLEKIKGKINTIYSKIKN